MDFVNKRGGLNMPNGKVKVEGVVADDEAKQDVGVRRYRYRVDEAVQRTRCSNPCTTGLCH